MADFENGIVEFRPKDYITETQRQEIVDLCGILNIDVDATALLRITREYADRMVGELRTKACKPIILQITQGRGFATEAEPASITDLQIQELKRIGERLGIELNPIALSQSNQRLIQLIIRTLTEELNIQDTGDPNTYLFPKDTDP